MTGIMSVTGFPGQGPLRVGVAVTDIMAGAFLAQGVLIALLDREVSGEGRWVQTSLLEAGITLMDFQATRWTMDKKVPPQEGNNHPTNTPMGLFPTADGFLNLSATGNKNFAKFCKLIDREKMVADPRFAIAGLRARNREALNELIATALRARYQPRMVRASWWPQACPAAPSTTSRMSSPIRRSSSCASSAPSTIRASANST